MTLYSRDFDTTSPTFGLRRDFVKRARKNNKLRQEGFFVNGLKPKSKEDITEIKLAKLKNAFMLKCPHDPEKIYGRNTRRDYVIWRHALMHFIFTNLKITYERLGQAVGWRANQTVFMAVKKIEELKAVGDVYEIYVDVDGEMLAFYLPK